MEYNESSGVVFLDESDYDYRTLVIPEGATNVRRRGELIVTGCRLREVLLPTTMKIIGYECFCDCTNLCKIDLSQVENVESYAFAGTQIEDVCLLRVKSLGRGSFAHCRKLKVVNFGDETVEGNLSEIPERAFEDCGITQLTTGNVTKIGIYAFLNCCDLKNVEMHHVHIIGDNAFRGCKGLMRVIFQENGLTIGRFAFAETTVLSDLVGSDKILEIKEQAFRHSGLKYIVLEDFYAKISEKAFLNSNIIKIHMLAYGSRKRISWYMRETGAWAYCIYYYVPTRLAPTKVFGNGKIVYELFYEEPFCKDKTLVLVGARNDDAENQCFVFDPNTYIIIKSCVGSQLKELIS